jgi:hypothetical protein
MKTSEWSQGKKIIRARGCILRKTNRKEKREAVDNS